MRVGNTEVRQISSHHEHHFQHPTLFLSLFSMPCRMALKSAAISASEKHPAGFLKGSLVIGLNGKFVS